MLGVLLQNLDVKTGYAALGLGMPGLAESDDERARAARTIALSSDGNMNDLLSYVD